jgi:hypothetical protein
MTGAEHYAEAERLLTLADRHASGATYGPEWTLTLTAAQVHATLALAAATAVGTAGPAPPSRKPLAPAARAPAPCRGVHRPSSPNQIRRARRGRLSRRGHPPR